jgi:dipeptidyl aminopeptidase/acylaminoacyl peptidase
MRNRFVLAAVVATLAFGATALAQEKPIAGVLDALAHVRAFHGTAISPDGQRIAWVVDRPEGGTAILLRDLKSGAEPVRVTAAASREDQKPYDEGGLAWSPDGQSLAFLSDATTPGQLQVCRFATPTAAALSSGISPGCFTKVKGQLSHLAWSADSRQIAFLFVSGSTQGTGALVAYKPDSGVVGDIVEEQRIAIVDPATGNVREVSPANLYVYDYDWAPDGRAFAAEAVEGSGTNNYWIAQLYAIRLDTGIAMSIWKPPLQIAGPRWSPDGKSIAVIHGIMSDEGQTGGDVYLVPVQQVQGGAMVGGSARNITPSFDGSVRALAWRATGGLLLHEYVDGNTELVTVGATGGTRVTVWTGEEQQLTDLSLAARSDAAAAIVQSFAHAPEVWAGPFNRMQAQTTTNEKIAPLWGDAKSLHWTSDKYRVQGWLLYPSNYDASKKYPMVVSVHGGPSAANFPVWPTRWNAVLPTRGYFVFLPNPRGSYGNGEPFTQANVNDFGYGDLRDIEAGVDTAVKSASIDANRVGIIGWSYGGYMAMWAVTQSTRFHAAVAGAGIANWQSYYGENKIDTWMLPFFGASVYDKPEAYARSSPIAYIKKVKTPTLVLHGDRDSEVPTPQGYEFWHALKALHVPTELVIYPDEGHAIAKPEHQRDIEERLVAWFDRYLVR